MKPGEPEARINLFIMKSLGKGHLGKFQIHYQYFYYFLWEKSLELQPTWLQLFLANELRFQVNCILLGLESNTERNN